MVTIYVDGGVYEGVMHLGVVSTSEIYPIKFSKKLTTGATHTAEEEALYHCIQIISSLNIQDEITVFSDQISIVNMVNAPVIKSKVLNKFPRINEIREVVSAMNITLKWTSGKSNLAHQLVVDAYNNTFYNEIQRTQTLPKPHKTITPQQIKNNNNDIILILETLKKDLEKKDIIIKDLIKIISKLNNCHSL